MKVPLSSPWITEQDQEAVLKVLQSRHLALGPTLREFEKHCATRAGVAHAVATSSGTAALTLAARALGWGPGDEILTPSFSFVASANIIMHVGAKPIFVDIDQTTLNIDPADAQHKITDSAKGILAVDLFGLACDGQALDDLCRQHHLDLVEDACEAVGALHDDGRPCGSLGQAGAWAFYPNKQITTGEGGMFFTNDESLAQKVRCYSNQGRASKGWFDNVELGWNYRMSDLNAALGLSQLERLDEILKKRQQVARWYHEQLSSCDHVSLLSSQNRSWFVYVVVLNDDDVRDELMSFLSDKSIDTRPYFPPIHLMTHMVNSLGTKEGSLPHTESLSKRTLALPFSTIMTQQQVVYVSEALKSFF